MGQCTRYDLAIGRIKGRSSLLIVIARCPYRTHAGTHPPHGCNTHVFVCVLLRNTSNSSHYIAGVASQLDELREPYFTRQLRQKSCVFIQVRRTVATLLSACALSVSDRRNCCLLGNPLDALLVCYIEHCYRKFCVLFPDLLREPRCGHPCYVSIDRIIMIWRGCGRKQL